MAENGVLKADILEIFSSIQGEGPFMGIKQIFIRFARCNLNCRFCDVESVFPPKYFSRDKLTSVVKQINANSGGHHSVSLTGGEPLLYKDFLKGLLPALRHTGLKIYMDTNATLPAHLEEVIHLVDIIAADFKLPGSTGCRPCWDEHKEFLEKARRRNCFVKVVVTNETAPEEIGKAVEILAAVDKNMLMVLQPAWPVRDVARPRNRLLFDFLFEAERELKNVRIMPQLHKVMGVK